MKATGIVFSNIYDSTLGELTNHRTVASLPFGSRYRQIDFILSNMSNSYIYRVGLITKYNYRSLMDHLGDCSEWDLNRKNEGLFFLPPFVSGNTGIYKGKLEALYTAVNYLDQPDYDVVVVADSTVLCNLDFRPAISQHLQSGADVTIICNREASGRTHPLVVRTGEDGQIREILIDAQPEPGDLVGMGMFVFSRERLVQALHCAHRSGLVHLERDLLQAAFRENKLRLSTYCFDGVVLRNENIQTYFMNNMALLRPEVRAGLFRPHHPIYTKVRDEIPTYFEKGSRICNCLMADGCTLRGQAEKSILFRGVTLEAGAQISSCIVMQGTRIGKNARLSGVILDKNVTVRDGAILQGTPEHPVIIKKGETV